MVKVGIDPGAKGAVAIINRTTVLDAFNMPVYRANNGKMRVDASELNRCFTETFNNLPTILEPLLVIEKVRAMPRNVGGKQFNMGTQSSFQFGESFGIAKAVAEISLGVEAYEVEARVWKRRANLINSWKRESIERALDVFDNAHLWLTTKRGVLNQEQAIGRADAMLIAYHGRPLLGVDEDYELCS